MILYGTHLIIYGNKNGTLVPISGSRTCNVTVNAEEKIATPPPDSVWKSVYYGQLGYGISASGMCILNEAKFTHRDILRMQMNREYLTWACKNKENDQEYYSGKVMITQFTLDADMNDLELYSFSGTGTGPLSDQNPYEVILLGDDNNVVQGEGSAIIGYVETNGNLPINDNC